MSIRPAYLARVFPDPWPHELSLATAGGADAFDCVTDRMAAAGLVRRRGDSGKFEPRHKTDMRIERWRQKAGGV